MSYEVTSRTVTLSHDGLAVHTLIYEPKDIEVPDAGLPAVICSHGFRATFAAAEPYAMAFAAEGFVAAAFDFCGGGKGSLSSGDPSRMSIMTERQDLACVLDYVRSLDEVDPDRVSLMGQSQGGVVSSMLATRRPRDVRSLVLCYPAYVLRDDAMRLFGKPEAVPMTYEHMNTTLGRIYAVDAMAWEPYSHLGSYEGPVHIWHGDQDPIVPMRYAERAVEAFPNAELTVVSGAGHGFGDLRDGVIPELVAFLKEHA